MTSERPQPASDGRGLGSSKVLSLGIKGRDALRVQLFIHGYGLKVSEVRGAVRDEFLRGLRELRPQLRSQYFQNGREPGPGHLAAAERQLGSLDPRFASAGLKQPVQFMLKNTRIGFGVAAHSVFAAVEGLLLGGLNDHPLPKLIDDALGANDDAYISARDFLAKLELLCFDPWLVGAS
jgi:hypothetical protein